MRVSHYYSDWWGSVSGGGVAGGVSLEGREGKEGDVIG